MRPILNGEQKASLLYEIMLWASTNYEALHGDTTRISIFELMNVIVRDDKERFAATSQQPFIQELRKTGELWGKLRPFLKNSHAGCITPINPGVDVHSGQLYSRVCSHDVQNHIDGNCTGTNRRWQWNDGVQILTASWNRNNGKWIEEPCPCTKYLTRQKW